MDKLKKLKAAYQESVNKMQAVLDGADSALTEDQQTEFDGLKAEAEGLKSQISNYEALLTSQAEADRIVNAPAPALGRQVKPDSVIIDDPAQGLAGNEPFKVPARAKRLAGTLTSFTGPDADVRAYKAGMFFRAIAGIASAQQWCRDHGVELRWEALHQEGSNVQGGYLVYDELDMDIIKLVEKYGVFRKLARRSPMTSDTKSRNRRTGGLDAHFVGEGVAGTESTGSWDQVKLIAKKVMVLTRITNELQSDAVMNIADTLVEEIALAYAAKEDACGFLGDGTSTYGGIVGVLPRLTTVAWAKPSVNAGAGLVEWGTGTDFSNITLANLISMMALCPQYARLGAAWHCSGTFFDAVITRLVTAAGGNVANTIIDGVPTQKVLGFPVELNNTMNIVGTDQAISCLFGNLKQAADFGDRQGMTIAFSEHATVGGTSVFETDEVAVRGIERFDINVHDIGTSSKPGPIVGLMCYDAA